MRRTLAALALLLIPAAAFAQNGNRLAYLDEVDPYYPNKDFPKLITPQWVGEAGVEAVVILAIDDMRDTKKYEAFLRPLLRRLKAIDGRAPVSIMTNQVDPQDAQLQVWLKEGLSIECHTLDHPCPFFKNGFAKTRDSYDNCVELMYRIRDNHPVAFRMPCCDSLNTPSPRFYTEIFNKWVSFGRYLSIDSSVFNVFTSNDPALPRDLVLTADGSERFRRYLPADRSFVNFIEDYPYPYMIGRMCWQFPCVTPSDWQAQHLHKPNNPQTVKDWQAALDCTVIKKGVMTMVFHPHGWIKNDQLVELVDYADKRYGKKVKFLTFGEANERLEKNLLSEQRLRFHNGFAYTNNGIYLLDVNNDGFMDVVMGGQDAKKRMTRTWLPGTSTWAESRLPTSFFTEWRASGGPGGKGGSGVSSHEIRFGVMEKSGLPVLYVGAMQSFPTGEGSFWQFDGKNWNNAGAMARIDPDWLKKWDIKDSFSRDCTVNLADLDGDGRCELLYEHGKVSAVFRWSDNDKFWKPLPFTLPAAGLLGFRGRGAAARFVDLDGDGKLDIVFSNEKEYGVYLFKDLKEGWTRKIIAGMAGEPGALPMIAFNNDGARESMGFWVHSAHLWWSNETTTLLKDHVARVSIKELLKDIERPAKTP